MSTTEETKKNGRPAKTYAYKRTPDADPEQLTIAEIAAIEKRRVGTIYERIKLSGSASPPVPRSATYELDGHTGTIHALTKALKISRRAVLRKLQGLPPGKPGRKPKAVSP